MYNEGLVSFFLENILFEHKYMKLAISQAKKSFQEVPIGAVIVLKQKVIASCHNLNISTKDPTAHAEIVAIRKSALLLQTRELNDCDMYVTLEPCAMCAYAISLSKIRRLYFGSYNKNYGAVESGARVFRFCKHVPEIYGGILEKESLQMIKTFFKTLRKKPLKKL